MILSNQINTQKIYVIQNNLTKLFWMLNPHGPEFRWTRKLTNAIQFSSYEKAAEVLPPGSHELVTVREFVCTLTPQETVTRSHN